MKSELKKIVLISIIFLGVPCAVNATKPPVKKTIELPKENYIVQIMPYFSQLFEKKSTKKGTFSYDQFDAAINQLTQNQAAILYETLKAILENIEKMTKPSIKHQPPVKNLTLDLYLAKAKVYIETLFVKKMSSKQIAITNDSLAKAINMLSKEQAASLYAILKTIFDAIEKMQEKQQKEMAPVQKTPLSARHLKTAALQVPSATRLPAQPVKALPAAQNPSRPLAATIAKEERKKTLASAQPKTLERKTAAPIAKPLSFDMPAFAQAQQLLEPMGNLEKNIIALGNAFGIQSWQQSFEKFKQNTIKMRQAISKINFKTLEDANELVDTNQWVLLTLLGLKPVYSYSYPTINTYSQFKIILDAFRSDKDFKAIPISDYPSKLIKEEEYSLQPDDKPMLLIHDPLIPLSKVMQWYPHAKLTKKYPDHIQDWATYSFDQRMKLLEEWARYMYQAWVKREQEGKGAFEGNPFEELGHTEDEAAIILGFQPVSWKKVRAETSLELWRDFNNNLINYRAILRGGQVNYDDNSPYMQLTGLLFEYALRNIAGDTVYLYFLADAIEELAYNAYLDGDIGIADELKPAYNNLISFFTDIAGIDFIKKQAPPEEPSLDYLAKLITRFLKHVAQKTQK